ncbi:MAG: PAS domain S-box protein [Deltaproteobacteria bacterium]|nr:PAS domain S-box protein [Deltaproteobacteria bacterium]
MELSRKAAITIAAVGIGLVLYVCKLYGYLIFHSLTELFSIVIAAGIFIVAWNTRTYRPNPYILFIGIAFLFIASIDLLHTLAYKGMGVFPGGDANVPTQLWIAGRYLQGVSLLVAPYFIGRNLKVVPVCIVYAVVSLTLVLTVFCGLFPDAFVDGKGLTLFKVSSEFVISLILVLAILYLRKKKDYFEAPVVKLLMWSMIATIASEMAFTLYTDVYGFFNLLGHYFKVISYYLIYVALIKTNLKRPYETMRAEIEERKRTEEKLKASESQFRELLENMQLIAVLLDVNGKVTFSNKYLQKLSGYSQEKLNDSDWFDLMIRDALPEVKEVFLNALKYGEIPPHFENPIFTADGSLRHVYWNNTILRDATGLVIGTASIGEDITERKRFEEELKKYRGHLEELVEERTCELAAANERLKEVDRLKSMFIASMSHELRTPLNSVIGFSSILLNEWAGTLNDEQKKNLTSILRSGKHLLSLINDVIDVSKIEAGMIEIGSDEFDLAELLAELEQTFARQALGQQLSLTVQELHLMMHTDRRRLLQCMFNLVSNAIKFTEQGGVTVTVRHNETGGTVTIIVTDTGIGIAEADQPRLFKAFSRIQSRLTAKVQGTGLGLYLTKKIVVEILRGEIVVMSEAGRGSSFSMTIPVRVDAV